MVTQTYTVAFKGIEAIPVTVQIQIASSMPAFNIVGLADKAVNEAKERVRAALNSCGLALPAQRILVNLAPADLPKEGGHYDLPIALGLMAALGIIPNDAVENMISVGELSLDGMLRPATGILPAAVTAVSLGKQLVCSPENGSEALWAEGVSLVTPKDLTQMINYLRGDGMIKLAEPQKIDVNNLPIKRVSPYDLSEIRGQEAAKNALEITAAGGHNLLMSGPPGAGKSMLASVLPDILPPLTPKEMLEASLIASVSGLLGSEGIQYIRPYRNPHHSASMAALVGGGRRAMPGEISLAHSGILFLDELPEFKTDVLDSLRQPLESGKAVIARAEHHVTYPAKFQLVAAMNPCKCGYLSEPRKACSRAPRCGQDYTNKVSGPLLDRFDIRIELTPVALTDLAVPQAKGDTSEQMRERVIKVRDIQRARAERLKDLSGVSDINARASGEFLEKIVTLDEKAQKFLALSTEKLRLTARGYHRILRVARTIQDIQDMLDGHSANDNREISIVTFPAIATALAFRMEQIIT